MIAAMSAPTSLATVSTDHGVPPRLHVLGGLVVDLIG
jgi:hypothetical protein